MGWLPGAPADRSSSVGWFTGEDTDSLAELADAILPRKLRLPTFSSPSADGSSHWPGRKPLEVSQLFQWYRRVDHNGFDRSVGYEKDHEQRAYAVFIRSPERSPQRIARHDQILNFRPHKGHKPRGLYEYNAVTFRNIDDCLALIIRKGNGTKVSRGSEHFDLRVRDVCAVQIDDIDL